MTLLALFAALAAFALLSTWGTEARILGTAIAVSWLLSLSAFYLLPVPARPTANTLIDVGVFVVAICSVDRFHFPAAALTVLSIISITVHFAFAWNGLAAIAHYELLLNVLFTLGCLVVGGSGIWSHVVGDRAVGFDAGLDLLRVSAHRSARPSSEDREP